MKRTIYDCWKCCHHNTHTLAALAITALLLTACRTAKTTERDTRLTLDRLEYIESLLHQRTVTETDSAWREQVLRQFQSISERRDTSHTIVQDTAGNILRETIIIRETTERDTETLRHEREVLLHRLDVQDSIISTQTLTLHHLDSLLHTKQTVQEVPAELTWWQKFRIHLANIMLYTLTLLAVGWAIRWRLRKK